MIKLLILNASIMIIALSGCSNYIPAYKIDVQQGNILNEEDVNQLRIGMDKEKILYILGSPAITDPFHANRWDYTYYLKPGYGKAEKKNITLFFENNLLASTSGTITPDTTASLNVAEYKKQQSMVVNPVVKEKPGWLKRIWISFFGDEEDYEIEN